MTTGRYSRRNATVRPNATRRSDRENNFFLGLIGFSLFLHIIVAAFFLHNPTSRVQHRTPPLYVDLVMAPVANPQRGSAGTIKKIAEPLAAPKQPTVPTPVPKEQVVGKGKAIQKTAEVVDDDIRQYIAKTKQRLTDKAELDDTQASIAAMRKKTPPTAPVATAVGTASGTGDEAGGAIDAWLQKEVKEKWNWPGRKRKDLSAEVEVEFDTAGKLSNYRFVRTSGDALFDKSLTNALLKLEALPIELRKPFQETIVFNLDDLQGP